MIETLHSQALRGNALGDTPDRKVTIYLPPSYESERARRYPVLYLLHGMTSDPKEWLDGTYQGLDLRTAMDELARTGSAEYLVVMPMADNSLGGSFYVNSQAFGGWDDFVAAELVRFVDARYRTRPDRDHRGLAGQSMGGFGALYLAGRHPDVFGHVYAMSACCLDFVGELAPDSKEWSAPRAPWIRAMAAAFASQARDGRGGALAAPLPFEAAPPGPPREIGPDANAWRAHLPLEMLKRDPDAYRRLRSIGLEYGRQDEIASVRLGTLAFADELKRAGIPHALDGFTGGHTDQTRKRFEQAALPFFAHAFAVKE